MKKTNAIMMAAIMVAAMLLVNAVSGINFGNVAKDLQNKIPEATKNIDPYQVYKAYFKRVDQGKKKSTKLPANLINMLKSHFRGLKKVTAFESKNVHGQNAMTDCMKIYFPANSGMINKIKNGYFLNKKDNNLQWLLHELQHTQQCQRVGGRAKYANVWFKQVKTTTLIAANSGQAINEKSIHDSMPMEKEADSTADRILAQLK